MSTWWSEHPDLGSTARRGRRELEEEAVDAERDAELLRKRRRTLTDVCFEWMSRGDLVTISTAGHEFEGRLVLVINDLAVIATRTLEAAVNIGMIRFVRSDRTAVFEGTTGKRTVSSFRAELGRYEVEALPARFIGDTESFDLKGVIEASSDDHVLVRDVHRTQWAVARSKIACVITDADGRG
ncbi:MAG: hypothetical protein U9N84_10230 [Actinomycetota bacterium]|nr:hypothetical protein [Actinomycetota bacterium]